VPTYDYLCDTCGHKEEHFHSFYEEDIDVHDCPTCNTKLRRLITLGGGIIFKGSDWPSKELKQEDQDAKLHVARRKAKHLKESGAVPWDEQIKQKEATTLHDKLENDMRKREEDKIASGKLARDMDAAVKEK